MKLNLRKTLLILAAFVILVYLYKSGILGKARKSILRTLVSLKKQAEGLFKIIEKMDK